MFLRVVLRFSCALAEKNSATAQACRLHDPGFQFAVDYSPYTEEMQVVLEEGDVLYFPSNWAHHTEALPSGPSDRGDCSEPGHHDQAQGAAGGAEPEDGVSFSLGFRTDGTYLL